MENGRFEKDFYETLISAIKKKEDEMVYIISERDSLKGTRVSIYDLEKGKVLREYKCRNK